MSESNDVYVALRLSAKKKNRKNNLGKIWLHLFFSRIEFNRVGFLALVEIRKQSSVSKIGWVAGAPHKSTLTMEAPAAWFRVTLLVYWSCGHIYSLNVYRAIIHRQIWSLQISSFIKNFYLKQTRSSRKLWAPSSWK